MKSLIDHYYVLNYNTFSSAPLLLEFYKELKGVSQNLLLAHLVIPICNHPAIGDSISRAMFGEKRRSTIWSIFDDYSKLYDLQDRVNELQSLQYAYENELINIDYKSLTIRFNDQIKPNDADPTKLKAAQKLGKLFSNHSLIEIYNHLKIKPQ